MPKAYSVSMRFPLIMAMVTLTISATERPSTAQQPNIDRQIAQSDGPIPLEPEADTDIILSDVVVELSKDGTITISAEGASMEGKSDYAYDFEFDLAQATYKTTEISLDEVDFDEPQKGGSGENPEANEQALDSPPGPWMGPLAVAPGTYSARVLVQTLDLAFYKLAETTDYLKWIVYSNGTVAWNTWTDGCWGAWPSPAGTHWSVTYCSSSTPWYASGNLSVNNEVSGNYRNYDWGNPSLATYSTHWVRIQGKNDGHCAHWWSYTDSGEDAGLIFGRRVVVSCP